MDKALTPTQDVSATSNPQNVSNSGSTGNSTLGASDATPFQQSAGADVLNTQNRSLQVVTTGKPLSSKVASHSDAGAVTLFIIGSVVVVVIIIAAVRWLMQRPDVVLDLETPAEKASAATLQGRAAQKASKAVAPQRPKGKKKQPRSRRHR